MPFAIETTWDKVAVLAQVIAAGGSVGAAVAAFKAAQASLSASRDAELALSHHVAPHLTLHMERVLEERDGLVGLERPAHQMVHIRNASENRATDIEVWIYKGGDLLWRGVREHLEPRDKWRERTYDEAPLTAEDLEGPLPPEKLTRLFQERQHDRTVMRFSDASGVARYETHGMESPIRLTRP